MRQPKLYDESVFQRGLWTPDVVKSKLSCWYDASDLSCIGLDSSGKLQYLYDKSGKGIRAQQTTAGNRLDYNRSGTVWSRGNPCWTSADQTTLRNIRIDSAITSSQVFIVCNWAGGTESGTGISGYLANEGPTLNYIRLLNNSYGGANTFGTVYYNGSESSVGTATPIYNYLIRVDHATSDTIRWYISGSTSFASRNWKGDVMEFLVLNSKLTNEELYKMEGYLCHKWNIFQYFRADHPYINLPPDR
jgi:hypothetical protein